MKGYLVKDPDGDYRTHDDWGSLCEACAYTSLEEAKLDADEHNGTIEEVDLEKYIRTRCMFISEAKEGFECLKDNLQQKRDFKTALDYVAYKFFWWRNNE